MVLASAAMARKLSATVPQLTVPPSVVDLLERDPDAGVGLACDTVVALRESKAFDGVHLIPVRKFRTVASRLEAHDVARAKGPGR